MSTNPQTYNDGIVKIYSLGDNADAGDMPKDVIILKHTLRYAERTVGIIRFYSSLQANIRVKYMLRCPRVRNVSGLDIAVPNDGLQYKIIQVQYPEDVTPPSMDLTLEEVTAKYEI